MSRSERLLADCFRLKGRIYTGIDLREYTNIFNDLAIERNRSVIGSAP